MDSTISEGPGPQSSIPERKAGCCHARSIYVSIIFIQEARKGHDKEPVYAPRGSQRVPKVNADKDAAKDTGEIKGIIS